jgi:ABC-type sugar transport system ATPase subunit
MIVIQNLKKYVANHEILKDISIDISTSEILVLSGPSGCGKTTLLRTIAGFEKPDKGKIFIDNLEASTPETMIEPYKRNIAMIFQNLALWPHMTVEQHVKFPFKKQKKTKEMIQSKIDDILTLVKLDGFNNRYPDQLSGGERQRLAIARALASKAKYLLMDEPFSNLDSLLKNELCQLIIALKQNYEMGILYVTHHIEDIYTIADRVAIMQDGKIVQLGTVEDLLNKPKNELIIKLIKR